MLNEFIQDCIKKIQAEKNDLLNNLRELTEMENEEKNRVRTLLEKEDVGLGIFSPRASLDQEKKEIEQIQRTIEDLQIKQAIITEKLAERNDREKYYQNLLMEYKDKIEKEKADHSSASSLPNAHYKDDLKQILSKVETCLRYIQNDRSRCRSELKSLKYYISGLLSEE